MTMQTDTTSTSNTLPPATQVSVDTPVPTTMTTQDSIETSDMETVPITSTTSQISETTTTAVPTTTTSEVITEATTTAAPTTSELTTETIVETTTITIQETTTMKSQTDEATEEPTSAEITTMTTTEAITVTSRPTTDGIDTTDTTSAIPTTFDQTMEVGKMTTSIPITSTMISNDLTTTDQSATSSIESTQPRTTTSDLDEKTVTSQPVNPNTIGGTEQQIGGSPSLGLIVGPIGAVVLLLISGVVIAIVVALFRKHKKGVGRYSTSERLVSGVGEYAHHTIASTKIYVHYK